MRQDSKDTQDSGCVECNKYALVWDYWDYRNLYFLGVQDRRAVAIWRRRRLRLMRGDPMRGRCGAQGQLTGHTVVDVYLDGGEIDPVRVGTLRASFAGGRNLASASFVYDAAYLARPESPVGADTASRLRQLQASASTTTDASPTNTWPTPRGPSMMPPSDRRKRHRAPKVTLNMSKFGRPPDDLLAHSKDGEPVPPEFLFAPGLDDLDLERPSTLLPQARGATRAIALFID